MDDPVLPKWAKEALVGKTIESVSEDAPHTLSLSFREGYSLTLTAMPFNDGVLDASFVNISDLPKP